MKIVYLIAVLLGVGVFVISRSQTGLGATAMWTVIAIEIALFIPLAVRDVSRRRRLGQSWSQALAQGKNTATGSVWYDGAILLGVIVLTMSVVWLVLSL